MAGGKKRAGDHKVEFKTQNGMCSVLIFYLSYLQCLIGSLCLLVAGTLVLVA